MFLLYVAALQSFGDEDGPAYDFAAMVSRRSTDLEVGSGLCLELAEL
jgi:hypothetical protein